MAAARLIKFALVTVVVVSMALGGYLTRETWRPWVHPAAPPTSPDAADTAAVSPVVDKVIVSEQGQLNLGLIAKPLKARTYWKTLQVPGMVVDRPGLSDRGLVAPATAVVAKIAHHPGDTVRPGETLFTLKLLSESLHQTQSDLFKATQDIILSQAQQKRMNGANGAIPEARMIEVKNQITRLEVVVKAYREDLLNRGLSPRQVDAVAEGKFVREITVAAPPMPDEHKPLPVSLSTSAGTIPPVFELQDLKVELGQQVQAGQTLCMLANHQQLNIEGRAFRDEIPLLERGVLERWPVEVDFQEDSQSGWPPFTQSFRVGRLSSTIDPVNRTFTFQIPLENQSRAVEDDGEARVLWRFRPGQKVRILLRVERLDNVFVLPADAVVHEGAEAYVFTQNVNTFQRKPVRVLLRDRQEEVIANDGSLVPGSFVTQSAAGVLNRMIKSASGGGVPKGYHMHADGSLHKNEDEGK